MMKITPNTPMDKKDAGNMFSSVHLSPSVPTTLKQPTLYSVLCIVFVADQHEMQRIECVRPRTQAFPVTSSPLSHCVSCLFLSA